MLFRSLKEPLHHCDSQNTQQETLPGGLVCVCVCVRASISTEHWCLSLTVGVCVRVCVLGLPEAGGRAGFWVLVI